jgi:hypothetical protein
MLTRDWQLFIHSIVLLVEHHGRDARGAAEALARVNRPRCGSARPQKTSRREKTKSRFVSHIVPRARDCS